MCPTGKSVLVIFLVTLLGAGILAILGVGVVALANESRRALVLSLVILAIGAFGVAAVNCLLRIFSVHK